MPKTYATLYQKKLILQIIFMDWRSQRNICQISFYELQISQKYISNCSKNTKTKTSFHYIYLLGDALKKGYDVKCRCHEPKNPRQSFVRRILQNERWCLDNARKEVEKRTTPKVSPTTSVTIWITTAIDCLLSSAIVPSIVTLIWKDIEEEGRHGMTISYQR